MVGAAACSSSTKNTTGSASLDLSAYSKACNQDDECVGVTGEVQCDGCNCGTPEAIATSALSQYDSDEQALQNKTCGGPPSIVGVCNCPAQLTPRCVNHVCTPTTFADLDAGSDASADGSSGDGSAADSGTDGG
jgi:hypothetical protein